MSTNLEFTDSGVWIRYREGRSRFFLVGSSMYERVRAGLAIDSIEEARRVCATGTHEPIVGYRNLLTGEWSIPPDPSIIPAEATDPRFERRDLRTLAEADAAAREMREHMAHKFSGDGSREFTEGMDEQLGSPLAALRDRMAATHSNFERDTIRLLLTDLEAQAREREQVSTEMFFHRREFDR